MAKAKKPGVHRQRKHRLTAGAMGMGMEAGVKKHRMIKPPKLARPR